MSSNEEIQQYLRRRRLAWAFILELVEMFPGLHPKYFSLGADGDSVVSWLRQEIFAFLPDSDLNYAAEKGAARRIPL